MTYETAEEIGRSISLYETKEKKRSTALNLQNRILKDAIKIYKDTAFKDPLTDLPNRRYFDIYLSAAIIQSRNESTPLSLIAFDLDHFKWVNDIYSHRVGDKVLIKLRDVLPNELRLYDYIFLNQESNNFEIDPNQELKKLSIREGGEEFYVVMPNTSFKEAMVIAERIRYRIEKLYTGFFNEYTPMLKKENRQDIPEKLDRITASVGVATTDMWLKDKKGKINIEYNIKLLKQAADLGAYVAKATGRNKVGSVCLAG
jgi:GGDEF domain-containing protein